MPVYAPSFTKDAKKTIKFYKKEDRYAFYANTFPCSFKFNIHGSVFGKADLVSVDLACLENAYQALKCAGDKSIAETKLGAAYDLLASDLTGGDSQKAGQTISPAHSSVRDASGQEASMMQYDQPFDASLTPEFQGAKDAGGKIRGKRLPSYRTVKEAVMKDLLLCKFTQNRELLALLLNDHWEIIENTAVSSRDDPFWGNGKASGMAGSLFHMEGSGRNALGNLLMEIREELRLEYNTGKIQVREGLSQPVCQRLGISYQPHIDPAKTFTSEKFDEWKTRPSIQTFLGSPTPHNLRMAHEMIQYEALEISLKDKESEMTSRISVYTRQLSEMQGKDVGEIEAQMVRDKKDPNAAVMMVIFQNQVSAEAFAQHVGYDKNFKAIDVDGHHGVILGPARFTQFLVKKSLVSDPHKASQIFEDMKYLYLDREHANSQSASSSMQAQAQ